ncbi:MAG: MFS transporter [Candidatus Sumerlaeota bacterium]|nr:MFS transporter [Candidatus Sumerlaeota bacterium]
MIVTQQKRIPWSWVFFMTLPGFATNFVEGCSGNPLTFTMRKFIDNPALITSLFSVNILFNFAVAPFIAYQSDRIWTRWGRRKPFIISGWIGLIVFLALTPVAPTFWTLAICIVCYQFFEDIAFTGPWTPLFNEVVPLPQRGRAQALGSLFGQFTGLYFNFILIGHFDDLAYFRLPLRPGRYWTLTGEQTIYWMAAALVIVMVVHVAFNLKEAPVHSPVLGERFSMLRFLKSVFGERQWLLIYILIFSQIALNQGLGPMGALMTTEQFGYSKAQLGEVGGWVTIARMAIVIPLAGYFADKLDRLKMFQTCLVLSTLHHFTYWTYIHVFAPNHVPPIPAMVAFDVAGSFVNLTAAIAIGPLLFDFVPRDRMGTVFAGMSFVRGMVKIVVLNGVGVWITGFSRYILRLPKGQYDYSSGMLYTTALGILGILASIYFAQQRKIGRVIEYGRLELQDSPPATPAEAAVD